MIENGDRIGVAISGGKDSLLMAKLLQELARRKNQDFQLEFIAMDPGYNLEARKLLEENCKYLNIPVRIYKTPIFEIADKMSKSGPCYICARIRRGALYSKAEELGCNKLALGHHFNDVIETTLLNLFYSGNFKTMMPKLRADNFKNIELIRPLFLVEEEYIKNFIQATGIKPLDCACTITEKKLGSKRKEIKKLIESLKISNKYIDRSIFKAAENVDIDRIIGWKKDGEKYSFLDRY